MPYTLRIIARMCVGLAIAMLSVALWQPLGAPWALNVGLALLVSAFGASLIRHYILRSPIPVRGGALISIAGNPVGYHVWYLASLTFCSLLLYILLHSFV